MSALVQITTKSTEYAAARKVLGEYRKVFDSVGGAITALRAIFATEGFPQNFAVVAARVDEAIDVTGEDTIPPLANWPEEYRREGVLVAVSFIGVRGIPDPSDSAGKKVLNGAQGFAIYPLHPQDAIMADEAGQAWLWKIIEKEASHVAFRKLRGDVAALGITGLVQAAMEMPLSVSDYVEESASEAMDTTAFDALWKDFRKMMSENAGTAAIVSRLPNKAEVLKCIRSKPYAMESQEELEAMNVFEWMGTTMAALIDGARAAAIEKGNDFDIDSDELKGWIAGRETKTFNSPKRVLGDLSTVDFSKFGGQ